jgi:hypothetical protein
MISYLDFARQRVGRRKTLSTALNIACPREHRGPGTMKTCGTNARSEAIVVGARPSPQQGILGAACPADFKSWRLTLRDR